LIRFGFLFFLLIKNLSKISGLEFPLLDERYFVWFEEVDFCRQIYKMGGEVWYNSKAFCVDYVGQSFSLLKRGRAQKYFLDSMLKYFKNGNHLAISNFKIFFGRLVNV
jgi:hypothetical protein